MKESIREKVRKRRREKRKKLLLNVVELLASISLLLVFFLILKSNIDAKEALSKLEKENRELKFKVFTVEKENRSLYVNCYNLEQRIASLTVENKRLRKEVSRGEKREKRERRERTRKIQTVLAYKNPSKIYVAAPQEIRRLALQAISSAGLNPAEVDYLMWIIKRESGFRVGARSSTGKYVGLGQLSPTLRERYNVKTGNTYSELLGMCRYIKSRYGSIYRAYRWWQSHHWY